MMSALLRRCVELLLGAGVKFYIVLMILFLIVFNLQNTYLEVPTTGEGPGERSFFAEFHRSLGNTWAIMMQDQPALTSASGARTAGIDYSQLRANEREALIFTVGCLLFALSFALIFMVLHFYSMARWTVDWIGALSAWLPYVLPVLLIAVLLKDLIFAAGPDGGGLGSFMRRAAMDSKGGTLPGVWSAMLCALVVLLGDGRLGQIMQAGRESFQALTRESYMQYVRSRGAATWKHGKYELALTFFDQVWVKVPQLISLLMVVEIFFSQNGLGLLLKKQLGILVSAKSNASPVEYISFFMTIMQIVAIIIIFDLVYGIARVLIDPRARHATA